MIARAPSTLSWPVSLWCTPSFTMFPGSQDEVRVQRDATTELGLPEEKKSSSAASPLSSLSPPPSALASAVDAAQRELTEIVNEARQKRDAVAFFSGGGSGGGGGVGPSTAERHLELKYARLKQQYEVSQPSVRTGGGLGWVRAGASE